MIILTILNSIAILYLLMKGIKLTYRAEKTFWKQTLLGFWIYKPYKGGHKGILYIPVRNRKKQELKEEVERLKKADSQSRLQTLTSIFSWLKTEAEVKQFEKDYSDVHPDIVRNLVLTFNTKN